MEPFEQAIQEHLELQRRNAALETTMPLDRYRVADALDKHGLFKSESEARREDNASSSWPTAESDTGRYPPEEFWVAAPAFDWGD
jgi:hypothetical protein